MIFQVRTRRFVFSALESVYFPAGRAGNMLRGVLGKSLWGSPGFAHIFAPKLNGGPSGLADPPRPFVFRTSHLDGRRFAQGESFFFDIHIFDSRNPIEETFAQAFAKSATRFLLLENPAPPLIQNIDLTAAPATAAVTVAFRTPVDLKGNPSPGEIPFALLAARLRDRIGTLSALYGDGPPDIDYKGMARRAGLIRTVSCDVRYRRTSRQSGSTGDVHPIGGFTGEAEYAGDLTEFIPWLRAAWWTGVGRHTVWGNGVIECSARPPFPI